MEVAKELEDRGISVGKFRPVIQHDIPPKPPEEASKEDGRVGRNKQRYVETCRLLKYVSPAELV